MSCFFIEIYACENECISGFLKTLNTIRRKRRLNNIMYLFYPEIKKKLQRNLDNFKNSMFHKTQATLQIFTKLCIKYF